MARGERRTANGRGRALTTEAPNGGGAYERTCPRSEEPNGVKVGTAKNLNRHRTAKARPAVRHFRPSRRLALSLCGVSVVRHLRRSASSSSAPALCGSLFTLSAVPPRLSRAPSDPAHSPAPFAAILLHALPPRPVSP